MMHSRAITKKSASNLALAFILLPRAKRDAMSALYAFCREVDDVADEDPRRWKTAGTARRLARRHPPRLRKPGTPQFVLNRNSSRSSTIRLPFALFDELIKGCEMDLDRPCATKL
jgi:15-cis-phytoene synthase